MGLKDGLPGRQADVGKFVCTKCKSGECVDCIDLKRAVYTDRKICQCPKHKAPATSGTPST